MPDQLKLAPLHRPSFDPAVRERHTFDFVVNHLPLQIATDAFVSDMCGCISDPRREPELADRMNGESVSMLTSGVPIGGGHRAILFNCPECADIGCGAVTVFVSRDEHRVRWSDFAYENGYEDKRDIPDVGPFEFDWADYVAAFAQVGGDKPVPGT